MFKSLVILFLALVPTAFAGPAGAAPPTHFSVDEPFSITYTCGLTEEGVFHRKFTTFYDSDGTVTYTLEQASFEGVITDPVTGETFLDRGHATVRFEPGFATGAALSGIVFTIHARGEGLLLLSAGRLIADADFNTVFSSARFLGILDSDAAVCGALG